MDHIEVHGLGFSLKFSVRVIFRTFFINMEFGAMQKVIHSPEGGGGLKNFHFEMKNEPFVTLLGEEGNEIFIFQSDILFTWPLTILIMRFPDF